MVLANYWFFLKNLRRTWTPVPRRLTKAVPRKPAVADAAESLEVRVVPAATPALSITPSVTVAEGNDGSVDAVLTVTLSSPSTNTVSVGYVSFDGTASSASGDYDDLFSSLTFAPGETSKTITVKVNGDTLDEGNETFEVYLYGATNARLPFNDSVATVTITDDDELPAVSLGAPDITYEGNSGTRTVNFPVTLTNGSSQAVTVRYATADGTALSGSDYVAKSGTVTFAPGQTTATISIVINGDTTVEPDEDFTVTLSAPTNSSLATATATAVIGDDDALPVLSVNNPAPIDEGDSGTVTLLFTVTLSSASTDTVTVSYATADGTATTDGNDYLAANGTLSFAPGQTTKTVSVVVKGDSLNEAHETIQLQLSNPTNSKIAVGTGTATITNDDETVSSVSIGPAVTVTEGDDGTVDAVFHVTLAQASGQTVTVDYATSNGTATLADNDYLQATGTVTFAPGETDKTFIVKVNGDGKLEGNETFNVTLSNPTNATIGTATRAGTITNDDGGTVSITRTLDAAETTPPTKGRFTVTQSGISATDTVVTYTFDGTATAGVDGDYEALSGTVTIPAGQTTAIIEITPVNDEENDEGDETVIVTLTGLSAHDESIELDPNSENLTATVIIVDATGLPAISVGGPAVTYIPKKAPIKVLPAATVTDVPLTGGTLSISVNAVTANGKVVDRFRFPRAKSLGATTGPILVNGQLVLTIDLNSRATASSIQSFLRGIKFSTKGAGLQTATRTFIVTLANSENQTNAATQTINIQSSNSP